MWLGDGGRDAWVEDDGEPDGLDAPPYALSDEVDDDPDGAGDVWADDELDEHELDDEWEAPPATEAPGRRIPLPAFALGALVGMLLLGLLWGATAMFGGGSNTPADRAPAGRNPGAQEAAATSEAPSRPRRLERCRRADAELAVPLRAATSAMDHWEVQIGAMNK